MKVLICIPCLMTGGTEIQTLNLVHALVEGGHEVTTACYFEHTDYMIGQYEKAGSKVVLFSPEGVRVGGLAGIKFLWRNLRKVVREFRPDVAHVQYMAPGAIPIILLWLMGQKNILATTHTPADIYGKMGMRMIHFLQNHVLRAFTCITELAEKSYFGDSTLLDENMDKILVKGKLPKHSHFTIYNSLPYGMHFTEERKPLQEGDTITIGVVSRLAEIKGMDFVVPAFAHVHAKHPNIRLIVVGEGEQGELMQQQANDLQVENYITWAGRQPQSELYKWYGKMDIVLMPSRSEGFGLTAIEAMANGCVMVASNTGGLPEVVKDGEVGLLHECGNSHDLAERIMQLIENPAQFTKMKVRVKDYVQQYSFTTYSNSVNNLYSKL